MTDEQYNYFGQYICACRDALGLGDWRIHLIQNERPENPDSAANILVYEGAKVCEIRLSDNILNETNNEKIQHYIVHELTHCYLEPLQHQANILQMAVGMDTWRVWQQSFTITMEHATDALATLLKCRCPMPPERTPSGSESEEVNGHA